MLVITMIKGHSIFENLLNTVYVHAYICIYIYIYNFIPKQRFGIGLPGDVAPRTNFILSTIIGTAYILGMVVCYFVVKQFRKQVKRLA